MGKNKKRKAETSLTSTSNSDSSPETSRTGTNMAMTGKMDSLIELMTRVQEDIAEIKHEAKNRAKEVEEVKQLLLQSQNNWKEERQAMNEKIDLLENRMRRMEKNEKRNNVIITNYDTESNGAELGQELKSLFKSQTKESVEIVEARKWRVKDKSMILVKFADFDCKLRVLKNKRNLHTSIGDLKKPIYVDDDQTKEEREIAFMARKCRNEIARKEGGEVLMKYEKGLPIIRANGDTWRWNKGKNDYVKQ